MAPGGPDTWPAFPAPRAALPDPAHSLPSASEARPHRSPACRPLSCWNPDSLTSLLPQPHKPLRSHSPSFGLLNSWPLNSLGDSPALSLPLQGLALALPKGPQFLKTSPPAPAAIHSLDPPSQRQLNDFQLNVPRHLRSHTSGSGLPSARAPESQPAGSAHSSCPCPPPRAPPNHCSPYFLSHPSHAFCIMRPKRSLRHSEKHITIHLKFSQLDPVSVRPLMTQPGYTSWLHVLLCRPPPPTPQRWEFQF